MLTQYEAKIIQFAATKRPFLLESDEFWDTTQDLIDRGFLVKINRGHVNYIVPTAEAIVEAYEALEQNEPKT